MCFVFLFFFNDTATTEIYTLSLHDALPISATFEHDSARPVDGYAAPQLHTHVVFFNVTETEKGEPRRSEEHTSELQSHSDLVCRLLLEKKKKQKKKKTTQDMKKQV